MAETDWAQLREESLASFTLDVLPTTLQLPALPLAVTRFIEAAQRPDVDLGELAAIVETDTGLTVELLRNVNSTFIGLKQKAKTARQSLALLGLRQSKLLVVTVGAQAAIRARQSKLINQNSFWNSSLQRAIFARETAIMLKSDPDVAFAGALLQDYLLPVLSNEFLDQYLAFTTDRDEHPDCITDYERQTIGCDHALVAAAMAHRWKLPDELVCCVLFHHRGLRVLADPRLARTSVAAVALSALLPDQLRQCRSGLDQLALLETKWPAFRFEELIETVDAQHAELGVGVGNDFPLMRRCRQFLDQRMAVQASPA